MADEERAILLDQFMQMTGTTHDFALSFLESSDWVLDTAIELFLGGQGGVAQEHRSSEVSDVEVNEEDDEVIRIMNQHNVDYETAKAIKDAGGGQTATGESADGVRAPILQKRARLFDTVEQEEYLAHDLRGLTMRPAFDAHIKMAGDAMRAAVAASQAPRPSRFAPPHWMMFAGTFEEAREEAKRKKRWLIVNLQDQSEFQSLVLNRDLWSDEGVQGFIRDAFVFWQQEYTSIEAQRFITLYNPTPPYPYVCIVDPRTGERAKVLKLKKKEEDLRESFIDQISDFLEMNSLETTRRLAPQSSSSASAAAAATPTSSSLLSQSLSRDEYQMDDEDAQIAAAIQASLQVDSSPSAKSQEALSKPDQKIESYPPLGEEPPASADVTVIQFRYPDGSRVRRRFLKSDPVRVLFSFVQQKVADKRFDLMSGGVPAESLAAKISMTLQDANVCNTSLIVKLL